jgi:phosphoglycerate dehydrogenase-like enzyme
VAAFRVLCVGEPPPAEVTDRLAVLGVEVVPVPAGGVRAALPELRPRGYLTNPFGPADGPRLTADLLASAPDLRLVTCMGPSRDPADYDRYVDVAALTARGIALTGTAGPQHGVAEAAVGLLHALELNLVHLAGGTRPPGTRPGLRGTTVGVIGMGQLGRQVTELLHPLGARLVYHSRARHRDVEERFGASPMALGPLLAAARHVTVHLPAGAPAGVIGAAELAGARGLMLVNTTSAPRLVDPAALLAALADGRVRRVAIEGDYPPPYQDALRELGTDRAVLLPAYTSWDTERARRIGWEMVRETYAAVLAGRPPRHQLA